jgi:hypothetical protein
MRRLLLIWMRGKKEVKMYAQQIIEISERLEHFRRFIPNAFARKPRSLLNIHCCIASWGLTRVDIATLNVIK